ncbi:MAG: alpha-amylase family glycosyl hydrolase [Thermotogae bacterium]|nr:alpha-amylase family glycosyl hydrolase [Thermotogota bacterium]
MQNWQYSQIVYQIFVDRFNRGKSFEEKVKKGLYGRDGGIVRNWEELPNKESRSLEFFGGDLEGIIEKIDYIKNLGINSIYLTPIFLAATNHKYDTHDFSVDPQFGDEQILVKLFEEAHKREIHVILDGVFNHVGVDGIWFNKSKKYGNAGAYNDPRSPFKEFFEFKTWPNEYRSWIDIKLLPELNLQNETLKKLLFTDENSIIKRYLKMGADGWRLDCAHDLGHETNSLIVESARSVKADVYVVGEVSGYPDEWLKLSKLDGVMNYYFSELLINTLNENFEPQLLKKGLDRMVEENGTSYLSKSWNMLSSHDTPRMNSLLKDRISKEIAIAFQIAYPGNPFLYYGEENGMNGDGDPDNRRPMVWNDEKWDWDFREFVLKAFDVKKHEPALNGGKRYLKMGADGWRLDCAHDLGHETNSLIVESARSVKADVYVVGEVSGYPDEWLKLSKLDGVMNYYFSELLINTLNENFEPQLLKKGLDRMVEENGTSYLSKSWNMLSSHDTPRMNSLLKDRISKEIAIAFQIAYPGNPFLYYGEENGMNGDGDPDNRRPMVWNDEKWDWDFREFVLKAFDVKKHEPALNGGNYLKLDFKTGSPVVGFVRYTSDPKDTLFFFANFSNSNTMEKTPIPFAYFMHHTQMERILGSGEAMAKVSEINLEMPSKSFGIFKFVPRFSMYRMYKSIK